MAKVKDLQRSLPFVTKELSQRLSANAEHRAVELLKQMLIDVILIGQYQRENDNEREDPTDPS